LCKTKINDFDLISVGCNTEDVLRLQVEVQDIARVHVVDSLADLTHEVHTLPLRQYIVIIYNSLKKFETSNAENI